MSEFSFVAVFFFLAIAGFVFWIWGLVDALRRPQSEWQAAGQNQILWVVVMVFLGFIGTILYLLIARPQLAGSSEKLP